MFGRREVKTHTQLMRDELNEGFEHLWQAAAHAADGVGATVTPRWNSTRRYVPSRTGRMRDAAAGGMTATLAAFAPLMAAARAGALGATRKAERAARKAGRRVGKPRRRRTTVLVGLLTAGVAAGAAGALVARRRNRVRWEEYEAHGMETAQDRTTSELDAATSAVDQGAQGVAGATDVKTDQVAEKAHKMSKNSRA